MPRLVRMQALADFQKRGHARVAGEVFDADQLTGFLLSKSGAAKFVRQITPLPVPPAVQAPTAPSLVVAGESDPPVPEGSAHDQTETHEAETSQPSEASDKTSRTRYRRRDLKAENPGGADEA